MRFNQRSLVKSNPEKKILKDLFKKSEEKNYLKNHRIFLNIFSSSRKQKSAEGVNPISQRLRSLRIEGSHS